jgi:hypothetical protein
MNSRLFPLTLAAVGITCVAMALAIARHGIAISQYAL